MMSSDTSSDEDSPNLLEKEAEDVVQNLLPTIYFFRLLSALYKEFNTNWQKYKGAFENSIALNMKETFSKKSVNVFHQKYDERLLLADGLFVNDNVVGLLMKNVTLRELPFLRQPDVTFNLPNHELRLDSGVSRIIIESEYTLFRNKSNIVYSDDLDPQTNSPFASSSVHNSGLLTIIASDCTINGHAVATLAGVQVHLLQNTFRVQNCRFYVEIYRPDSQAPPVMAPYFSLRQGTIIERLVSPKIIPAIMSNLQGAVLSTVNLTAVFGKDLITKMRVRHKAVFRETLIYLRKVVASMNRHTRDKNMGSIALPPLSISWDDVNEGEEKRMNTITLDKMTLYGLDSAYSSAQGGPVKDPIMRIVDKIRLGTLQVRGKLILSDYTEAGQSEEYEFAAEIRDLEMSIKLSVDAFADHGNSNSLMYAKGVNRFEVTDWRKVEFSILGALSSWIPVRQVAHMLTIAYLDEEVPQTLARHFYAIFEASVSEAEDEKNDETIKDVSDTVEDTNQMGNISSIHPKKILVIYPNKTSAKPSGEFGNRQYVPTKFRQVPMKFRLQQRTDDAEPLKNDLQNHSKRKAAANANLGVAKNVK